jgi:hypothetical protein
MRCRDFLSLSRFWPAPWLRASRRHAGRAGLCRRSAGTTWASRSRSPVICIAMTQSTDFLFTGAHDEFLRAVFRASG